MSIDRRIPSITYEPPQGPSLHELWECGSPASIRPPISVIDANYRLAIVTTLQPLRTPNARLLSVAAGNGYTEQALQQDGWSVLATDCAATAGEFCRNKGLHFQQFCLDVDDPSVVGDFDVVYCDGLIGHLWRSQTGTARAWRALRPLVSRGGFLMTCNDLSDGDRAEFKVRGHPEARFYRPPAGELAAAAAEEGWRTESTTCYEYERRGPRRRELLLMCRADNEPQ